MIDDTGTGHGFKITHEDEVGKQHIIEVHYNEMGNNRLSLIIDGKEIYLTMGESGYFLARMATWYDEGE